MPLDDHTLLLQLERDVERLTDASIDAIETVQQRIDDEVANSPGWDHVEAELRDINERLDKLDGRLTRTIRAVMEFMQAWEESKSEGAE